MSESVEAVILRALALKPEDRYATADAMQDALEEAMRKAALRGTATDLAKFMNETFNAEEAEQRRLFSQAQRGELGSARRAAQVSPVAAAAAAEAEPRTTPSTTSARRSIVLPPLAEESGRNWKADVDDGSAIDPENDSQERTRARPMRRAAADAAARRRCRVREPDGDDGADGGCRR